MATPLSLPRTPGNEAPQTVDLPLSRSYAARAGQPVIAAVDPRVFTMRYFGACMSCTFCNDWCCSHGVDVDGVVAGHILEQADEIERYTGVPRDMWFERTKKDPEMPGGSVRRSRTLNGACVFLNRAGRGCMLHAYALASGRDYHDVKPLVSALFPLTFSAGVLTIADELENSSLVCAGDGPTAYEASRAELLFYFGESCVVELDGLSNRYHQSSAPGSHR